MTAMYNRFHLGGKTIVPKLIIFMKAQSRCSNLMGLELKGGVFTKGVDRT
jgi:hypothetical protein